MVLVSKMALGPKIVFVAKMWYQKKFINKNYLLNMCLLTSVTVGHVATNKILFITIGEKFQ